jgi:excisionase family DNA binding protein
MKGTTDHTEGGKVMADTASSRPESLETSLLTVRRAAERLAISEKFLRRAIARGDLPVRRFGRAVRVSAQSLATFGN